MISYKNLETELKSATKFSTENWKKTNLAFEDYKQGKITLEQYREISRQLNPRLWTDEQVAEQVKNVKKALQRHKKENDYESVNEYIEDLANYTGDEVDEYWVINEAHENFITEELAYDTYSF